MELNTWLYEVKALIEKIKNGNCDKNKFNEITESYEDVRAETYSNDEMKEQVDSLYGNLFDSYKSICSSTGGRRKKSRKLRRAKKRTQRRR